MLCPVEAGCNDPCRWTHEVTRVGRWFDAPDDVFALFALRLKRV